MTYDYNVIAMLMRMPKCGNAEWVSVEVVSEDLIIRIFSKIFLSKKREFRINL